MARYKRAAVRVLLALSVAWAAWALYKPTIDWQRATTATRKQVEQAHNDCLAENSASLKTYEDTADSRRLDMYGSTPIFVDCAKQERALLQRLKHMTAQDYRGIYRETGLWRIAGFCLIPPAAAFGLLLLGFAAADWAVWYLNH